MENLYTGFVLVNGFVVSPLDTIDRDFLEEQE